MAGIRLIKIQVFSIAKTKIDRSDALSEEFIALLRAFGVRMEFVNIFSKSIKEGHKHDSQIAKRSYTQEYQRTLRASYYKIALDPCGRELSSEQFAHVLGDKSEIAFYLGGAYGLERDFIEQCHESLSLSKLVFSHKIAKVVLSEQIYRSFCLLNNHPYHK